MTEVIDSFITFNSSKWCAPALGTYDGCLVENLPGYTLHNWLLATLNLLAASILTLTYLVRLIVTKKRVDTFFIVASLTITDNVFVALWCILREIDSPSYRPPRWLIALMYTVAGTCIVTGINYLFLVYREKQTTENLLIYDGLKIYWRLWTLESLATFLCFLLYPLSSISTWTYAILSRLFWLLFAVIIGRVCLRGIYYGFRIRQLSEQVNRMVIWMLIITVLGLLAILLAIISPILIDEVTWLYHLFYGLMEGSVPGVSFILSWWSITVTQTSLRESSGKGDQNSSTSKASSCSIPLSYV